eukprot:gnl/TRDRNA2_/TRDRNA2_190128_c0_seq1.p1 gnl/TRDRNA2_/TRDRNA2_190128_c0~~gnl/TRDRNA2_/TRDRNA2_190128_c0_seq1.p1  ORF type:complete len:383 (+),score=54.98 gnl/TRDRNA2_/TRDRNA2_190128_c0_seq1:75-1223(+)
MCFAPPGSQPFSQRYRRRQVQAFLVLFVGLEVPTTSAIRLGLSHEQYLAKAIAEFPYISADLLALQAEPDAERRAEHAHAILKKAFDEPTLSRKHSIYMAVRPHESVYTRYGHTYRGDELQEMLEAHFLHEQLFLWQAASRSSRSPMPLGLYSRGQEFADDFQRNYDHHKCDKAGSTWMNVALDLADAVVQMKPPGYGKFCGTGQRFEKACHGNQSRVGRYDQQVTCGETVCADAGADELCCEHDHRGFDAVIVDLPLGVGEVRAQPCEVDRKFREGLKRLPQNLTFDDGGGQPFSKERDLVPAAMCWLFLNPCLEMQDPKPWEFFAQRGYRYVFKFGDYGPPSDCGPLPCYRKRIADNFTTFTATLWSSMKPVTDGAHQTV